MQAAGNVDGENGNAGGIAPVHQFCMLSVQRAFQSDAEQTVDDQMPVALRWNRFVQRTARRKPIRQSRFGVALEFRVRSGEHDRDVIPPFLELTRSDEGVAAIVTRSREHQDAFAPIAEQIARVLGRGDSRERHQGRWRRLRQYRLFDLPDLFGEKNRGKCFRHKGSVNQTQPWAGALCCAKGWCCSSSTSH
jgi:hypothetical protein